jgi:hypothetical protein
LGFGCATAGTAARVNTAAFALLEIRHELLVLLGQQHALHAVEHYVSDLVELVPTALDFVDLFGDDRNVSRVPVDHFRECLLQLEDFLAKRHRPLHLFAEDPGDLGGLLGTEPGGGLRFVVLPPCVARDVVERLDLALVTRLWFLLCLL